MEETETNSVGMETNGNAEGQDTEMLHPQANHDNGVIHPSKKEPWVRGDMQNSLVSAPLFDKIQEPNPSGKLSQHDSVAEPRPELHNVALDAPMPQAILGTGRFPL